MTDSHLFSEPVLETFSTPAQTPDYGAQNLRLGWAAGSLGPLERSTVPQAGGQKSEVTAAAGRAPPLTSGGVWTAIGASWLSPVPVCLRVP